MRRPIVRGAVVLVSGLFAVACDLLLGINDGHFIEAGTDGPVGPGVDGSGDSPIDGTGDSPSADAPPLDEGTDADSSTPDAYCGWCCVNASTAAFCDDFDDPTFSAVGTNWSTEVLGDAGGGSVQFGDAAYSPPRSFLSITDFSDASTLTATLQKDLTGPPNNVTFELTLQDASSCVPAAGDEQFLVSIRLGDPGDGGKGRNFFVARGLNNPSFGASTQNVVTDQVTITSTQLTAGWVRVQIGLNYFDGGINAALTLTPPGGAAGTYTLPFQSVPDVTSPALSIGSRGKAPCAVYYDNVTVY